MFKNALRPLCSFASTTANVGKGNVSPFLIERTSSTKILENLKEEFKKLRNVEVFNRVAANVFPVSAAPEKIVCEMVVEKQHTNTKGTIHGGLTAALTDIVTARALGISVTCGMASVELSVSYFLPVKIGDVLEISAFILKSERSIAFTKAEFRRKSDGKLAAKGKHTIAILPGQPGVFAQNSIQT